MSIRRILYVFIIVLVFGLNLNAEIEPSDSEPRSGRLPDGRAFRTDNQGIQLVDHLAELELSIDELNRRVHGLEYELEEKNNLIDALKRNAGREPQVVEKDLLNQQTVKSALNIEQEDSLNVDKNVEELKVANQKNIRRLEAEASKLKSRLVEQQESISSLKAQLVQAKSTEQQGSSKDAKELELRASLQANEQKLLELSSNNASLSVEKNALQQEISELKKEITALVQSRQNEGMSSTDNLAKLQNENKILKEQLTAIEQQPKLPAFNKEYGEIKEADIDTDRASFSADKMDRLVTQKAELKSYYNRVKGMSIERAKRINLQRQADGSSKLRVKLNLLKSRRGMKLDQVLWQVNNVNSTDGINNLKQDLTDIAMLIKEDLQLLERIAR